MAEAIRRLCHQEYLLTNFRKRKFISQSPTYMPNLSMMKMMIQIPTR